jgi:ABC-type nitrate/sulfonate/bicarbonate transport system substrate-binding protein
MKRRFRTLALVAAGLAATVALGIPSASASPAKGAAATVTIIEAGDQDFSSVDVLYWIDRLKANGIDVKFELISDAATALKTVISGQADMFIGSLPTAILAVANGGAKVHVIAANDQASDYILVAPNDVTLQNLNGKTMGIDTPGSAGQVAAQLALKHLKIDPGMIHYVTVGGSSARTTAVLAGRIDIAPIHSPLALQAEATGKVHELVNVGKEIGPYIQSGLIANDNWVSDNRALTQKVVNIFVNAERWANANEYRYVQYAQSVDLTQKLSSEQMLQVWKFYRQFKFFGTNGGICAKYVKSMLKLNQQLGSLPSSLPAIPKWLNSGFVRTYLKAHHQKPTTC